MRFFYWCLSYSDQKRTPFHKTFIKIYMILMFTIVIIALFMSAYIISQFLHHFRYIHLFNFLTLYSAPNTISAIKKEQVKNTR
ncbi:MAG: putative membrane protein [Polaribacter sp.]|jgi:uncharacterized membrane protein